jgi:WD40 repeat protein
MLESVERSRARTKIARVCHPPGERNPMSRHGARRPRKVGLLVTLGLGLVVLTARTARSQDEVRNFKQPILTVETGGHHAPVRTMIWQDGSTPALLSGGEDKVIKVWDFQTGPRLARSIRPPIWRGPAGRIHALAITKPDAPGQSYLAVGGYGVESLRGDLTIFRFPGAARGQDGDGRIPTGDVVARLLAPPENLPQQIGHRGPVLCLAFDPSGRVLASGSIDTNVILWDVPAFRPRAVLRGHTGDVRALAFSPDSQRLATTGSDGSIRLWDVATGNVAGPPRMGNAVMKAVEINTLAFSPNGQSIVVGRENGDIYRFDARNLAQVNPVKLATRANQGPVEFLTYSPNGERLAVSTISKKTDHVDPKTITCDVELRAMPAGTLIRSWQIPGLVYALAFSPNNDRLAYAGGPVQSIFVQELANLDLRPKKLEGQGSTPFDIGFTRDSQVIGFHRERFDPANPPATYEAFDLARRRFLITPRNQLQRAIDSFDGWTMRSDTAGFRLEAVHQNGRIWQCDLDTARERNWWSFTIIPPAPGHARPTVAVGCEAGVVVYDLDTGRRTRVFAGHGSAVVSLATSPDGRWIASSSLDQTVMLYPLEGCDVRPRFGATFQRRQDGAWIIARVEPRGFAAAMGLRSGDVIVRAATEIDQVRASYTPQTMAELIRVVDDLRPALDTVAFWARRLVQVPELGALELVLPPVQSNKRNNPLFTLMPGLDKEWVIWTPQGFYDTSIEGDARFLGWHINADFRAARPTDFVPISTYAKTMFQPKVLDRLWRTRDLDQALAEVAPPAGTPPPERLAYEQRPPRILFTAVEGGVGLPDPGRVLTVNVPNPRLGVNIKAEGSSKIASRRVVFDERAQELRRLEETKSGISEIVPVNLVPGRRTRLEVEAANESGNKRTETMDVVYNPPPDVKSPPVPTPSLVVLAIGNDQAKKPERLPAVRFAGVDADELANFVTKHLISRDGTDTAKKPGDRIVMRGQAASVESISQTLGRLEKRLEAGQLQKGDIVAVIVESHVLDNDNSTFVAGADTDPERKPLYPAVRTKDLSDLLGRFTDYGCRVVLFLDCVHDIVEKGFTSDVKSWVRELQNERRVITFVASKEGPSEVDIREGHGFFTLGVKQAFDEVVSAEKAQDEPYTLDEFASAMIQRVSNLSGRRQQAFCYLPRGIVPQSLFARP